VRFEIGREIQQLLRSVVMARGPERVGGRLELSVDSVEVDDPDVRLVVVHSARKADHHVRHLTLADRWTRDSSAAT
jgi:hypothetical protein